MNYSRKLFAPNSPSIAAMTLGDAIDAMRARGLNTEFVENPLPMFFPYKGGVTGNIAGDRLRDWRHPDVVPREANIQDTLDAIAYGYRKHTTRSRGWGKAPFAESKIKAMTPETPIVFENNGRYVLTQAPPKGSQYPWVEGGVTSRIGLLENRIASNPFVDIRDEQNLKKWAKIEGWDEEWARRYFNANVGKMQVGIPFKVVQDILTNPYEVKQGQAIATPVSRPIVLNSSPKTPPQRVAPDLVQQYLAIQDSLADLAYAAQSQYGLRDG